MKKQRKFRVIVETVKRFYIEVEAHSVRAAKQEARESDIQRMVDCGHGREGNEIGNRIIGVTEIT